MVVVALFAAVGAAGGVFLALGVAVPMALAGPLLWANHPWGPMITLLAGLALMSWIVVQVTLIGFGSWLQPTFFVVGPPADPGHRHRQATG